MSNIRKSNKITFVDVLIYLIVLSIISFLIFSWNNQKEETELIESNFELSVGRIIKFEKGQKDFTGFKYEYVYKNVTYYDDFFGVTSFPENYLLKKYTVKVYVDDPTKSIMIIDSLEGKSD